MSFKPGDLVIAGPMMGPKCKLFDMPLEVSSLPNVPVGIVTVDDVATIISVHGPMGVHVCVVTSAGRVGWTLSSSFVLADVAVGEKRRPDEL